MGVFIYPASPVAHYGWKVDDDMTQSLREAIAKIAEGQAAATAGRRQRDNVIRRLGRDMRPPEISRLLVTEYEAAGLEVKGVTTSNVRRILERHVDG